MFSKKGMLGVPNALFGLDKKFSSLMVIVYNLLVYNKETRIPQYSSWSRLQQNWQGNLLQL